MALAEQYDEIPPEIANYLTLRKEVHLRATALSDAQAAYSDVVTELILAANNLKNSGVDISALESRPVSDHPMASHIILEGSVEVTPVGLHLVE